MYTCPICGYNGLQYPPSNFAICPSCYTEFGYDDATLSHEQLRREWIGNGMPWMGVSVTPPPPGWNPSDQLFLAGLGYNLEAQNVGYSYSKNPITPEPSYYQTEPIIQGFPSPVVAIMGNEVMREGERRA